MRARWLLALALAGLATAGALATPGALDPRFGTGGSVVLARSGEDGFEPGPVLRLTDGRIVVSYLDRCGLDCRDLVLTMVSPRGRRVAGGAMTYDEVAPPVAYDEENRRVIGALAASAGGYLVVGPGNLEGIALARFTSRLRADQGFGEDGRLVVDVLDAREETPRSALGAPDGTVVTAGAARRAGRVGVLVTRHLPDGQLDPGFGEDGAAVTLVPGAPEAEARALLRQPDGTLVVAGSATFGGRERLLLARYLPDGTLDQDFGRHGLVVSDLPSAREAARSLIRQPDGRLVVVGQALVGGRLGPLVARYEADGRLDRRFGRGGAVLDALPGVRDHVAGGALALPGGRLLTVGFLVTRPGGVVLARYQSDGRLDRAFGAGGAVVRRLRRLPDPDVVEAFPGGGGGVTVAAFAAPEAEDAAVFLARFKGR